jgi:hypothetical protein
MIYIIGLDHSLQFERHLEEQHKTEIYTSFLQKSIDLYRPVAVAEEYSKEALNNNISSTARIANQNKITHLFCDPETPDRKKMGYKQTSEIVQKIFEQDKTGKSQMDMDAEAKAIEKKHYFPLRESYWLKQKYNFLLRRFPFRGLSRTRRFPGIIRQKRDKLYNYHARIRCI